MRATVYRSSFISFFSFHTTMYCSSVHTENVIGAVLHAALYDDYDQWCKQDQILKTKTAAYKTNTKNNKTKTKTTVSKQRHLVDLTAYGK